MSNQQEAEIVPVPQRTVLSMQRNDIMSIETLLQRMVTIQRVMKEAMQDGKHYGTIPGCGPKPTLLLPGAQKIAMVFRLAPSYLVKTTQLPNGHREYEITCTVSHVETGEALAQGVGSCSTMESKYRYRNASDYEVTEDAIPKDYRDRKQEYRKLGFGAKQIDGAWVWVKYKSSGKVENPDIADTYNTVLKMASKRAFIAATLIATAASDCFDQDLEELVEAHDAVAAETAPQAPQTPAPTKAETMRAKVEAAKVAKAQQAQAPDPPQASATQAPPAAQAAPAAAPVDPKRRAFMDDIKTAQAAGVDVAGAAAKCGFSGRKLADLTLDELTKLTDTIWPPKDATPAPEPKPDDLPF